VGAREGGHEAVVGLTGDRAVVDADELAHERRVVAQHVGRLRVRVLDVGQQQRDRPVGAGVAAEVEQRRVDRRRDDVDRGQAGLAHPCSSSLRLV
jgi:hypothetical protein